MRTGQPRLLKVASALTLIALALIVWGILHPVPLAVMAAMSIGQGIGTLGAVAFGVVVYRDLRSLQKARAAERKQGPASEPGSQKPPP